MWKIENSRRIRHDSVGRSDCREKGFESRECTGMSKNGVSMGCGTHTYGRNCPRGQENKGLERMCRRERMRIQGNGRM